MATTAFVTKNGDIIRWEIPVTNNGSQADTNVTVTGAYPAGVAYTTHTPVAGTTFTSSTPEWVIPTLGIGATKTLVVFTVVTDITLAPFVWTLTVDGDNVDEVAGNNELVLTVETTTCPPSAGAIADTNACLCGNVGDNDTLCTSGTTEFRLGSVTNLDPLFDIGLDGSYNTNGFILDPFADATFTYSIWCIVGEDEFETSGPVTVTIPAFFHEDVVFLLGDDTAYDATTWNTNLDVPTKNAVRDALVDMVPAKVYKVRLAQTGVGNPTLVASSANTLGEVPTLIHAGVGEYEIGLAGTGFTLLKTFPSATLGVGAGAFKVEVEHTAVNKVSFFTYDDAGVAAELEGDVYISIEVWS